jgi:hypothetical protein
MVLETANAVLLLTSSENLSFYSLDEYFVSFNSIHLQCRVIVCLMNIPTLNKKSAKEETNPVRL